MSAQFAVNGRFLTQPTTGVQRYARNVLGAMSAELERRGQSVPILAPEGAQDLQLPAMPLQPVGGLSGHAWEQLSLPVRWRGSLLNLCNTAPARHADQVVCIHDASVFTASYSYSAAFRTVYRQLQPMLVRRSARIATVSHDAARQIARHLPITEAQIAVLPNGHEHALAWDPSQAVAAKAVVARIVGRGRGYVLAIGSRARHKNLKLLVEIAAQLDAMGLDLVIAGGGAGIFAGDELRLPANAYALGDVTDHDLGLLMDNALCLAFPSWTEGFGLPVLEAMARGTPVVSSDRASMPEICADAALMAAPDAPAAWVVRIRELKASSALRQDLSGRGREQARTFSWTTSAQGYLEMMDKLAGRSAVPVQERSRLKVAVVVATLGRPKVVGDTVRHLLATQSLKPDTVVISVVNEADAGGLGDLPSVTVVTSATGLPAQRNAGLAALPADIDVVVFFDDDCVADAEWLAAAARMFREQPDVVAFTGLVLADGVKGPGLSFEEAVQLSKQHDFVARGLPEEPYSPYGCNMAFRASAIRKLKFDERLVLYGWLEDRDFGATLAKQGGRLIKSIDARGVHMGVKAGRVSGDRLGYSQVVNPLYMMRKGTMTPAQVADHILRNIASNVARSVWPEPYIDRRGRLRGNLKGIADVLRGRLQPERAASITRRSPS